MTAILHPIRTLRENLRVISAAVNASRAYSQCRDASNAGNCSGIPF